MGFEPCGIGEDGACESFDLTDFWDDLFVKQDVDRRFTAFLRGRFFDEAC